MVFLRKAQKGFTIIEILIVVAIITILGVTGVIFSLNDYDRSLCHSEKDTLVSLLYRERSEAMNNKDKTSHGLHIEPDQYILFSGDFFDGHDPLNEITYKSSLVFIASRPDIVFKPLTGEVDVSMIGDILIGDASSTCHDVISINHEGAIRW